MIPTKQNKTKIRLIIKTNQNLKLLYSSLAQGLVPACLMNTNLTFSHQADIPHGNVFKA